MIGFTPFSAIVGGALIGLAAVLLLKFNGRIAGISGIVNGVMTRQSGDRMWRLMFVVGLVLGGFLYSKISGDALINRQDFSISLLMVAGLLVGFGTRLGAGCTSGHGVCGMARLSTRSIVATLAFLCTGMLTASCVFLLIGGGS